MENRVDTLQQATMGTQRWAAAAHVLCVRLDTLGDVVLTTPAIRELKRHLPGRRITLLTSPSGAEAARLCPQIDQVIRYSAPWMKATGAAGGGGGADLALIERLRRSRFDAAVIFTVFSQNPLPAALACYLAEIPLRLAHCRENPYQLLTDWVREREPQELTRHEVQRQLELVRTIGCPIRSDSIRLTVGKGIRSRMASLLAQRGIEPGSRWAIVHPGATASSRRYPPESFASAAARLVADHGFKIVFTGTQCEVQLVEQIRRLMEAPSESLAGCLDVCELAALIAAAPLLIANNTGPVHLAAGLGTPVVDLYALTNPQHTPWRVPNRVLSHDVPCKYCFRSVCPEGHHECLRMIPPEAVAAAAVELLQQTGRRNPARRLITSQV